MSFTVETGVPYGNACLVEVDPTSDPATVAFAPHPHGGPEALWFCFRVRRIAQIAHRTMVSRRIVPAPRKVRLVLRNPVNLLGGLPVESIRPVAKYEGGDWERLGAGSPEELPDGRVNGAWTVEAPRTFVDVAFCYPYGMPEVEELIEESEGSLAADTIGASQAGRPIVRIGNSPGEPESNRPGAVGTTRRCPLDNVRTPGLYAVARQHSSETSGGWVLDGFLREIASLTRRGESGVPLVWAVPLANIDGVEQGDYGKDNFPFDLNRAWGTPPMRHETLVIQRDMNLWKTRCRPVLGLDFHSPGGAESDGIYAYLPDPEEFPGHVEAANEWAAVFKEALGEYAAEDFGRVAKYPSRWQTPSFARHARSAFGVVSLTLETPYALCGDILMTRERYREAGSRIARAAVGKAGSGRPSSTPSP